MERTQALIVLDTEVVATTKVDQAIWLLAKADRELADMVDRFSLLDVTSDEEKVEAEQGVMAIRKTRKEWDATRKEWGQPLDATKKVMDGAIRQRDDPAGEIEARLIGSVNAYTAQIERERLEREAEARKIAEEANRVLREKAEAEEKAAREKAAAEKGTYIPPPVVGIPEVVARTEEPRVIPKAEGIGYVRVWKYRVDDLAKVPNAYTKRVLDEDAVKVSMKAATITKPGQLSQCTAQIPGITIYHEDRPRVG